MDKIKEYAKALGAFLTVLAGAGVALAADPNIRAIFPAEWIALLAVLGGAGVVGGVVAGVPNKITPQQVAKSGISVAPVGTTPIVMTPPAAEPESPLPTRSVVDDIIAAKHRAK